MVRMRPTAISLNYSVENIRNDVCQKIIIYDKSQFNSLGIPLLEAYLLPMANNRTRKERLSQEQNGR